LRANTNINLKEVEIMSESQMKDRIAEELKKAKEAGKDATKAAAEAVGKAANIIAEDAKEFGKRAADVAKEGISGMWKGAKEAIKKDKKE